MTRLGSSAGSLAVHTEPAAPARAMQNQWLLTGRRLLRHKLAVAGAVILAALVFMSAAAPLVTSYDPDQTNLLDRLAQPTLKHLMGTDHLGRDVFTRVLYGGRISLAIGISVALSSVMLGGLYGASAGYAGGQTDNLAMRVVDVLRSLPMLVILLVLASIVGYGFWNIVAIMAATGWMSIARIVRGVVLSLKHQDFVLASQAVGATDWRIITRHLLPNSMAPMIVATTLGAGNAIRLESFISFLGLGIQPPTPSWGNLLTNAQQYLIFAPWVAFFPGLVIFLTLLSVNFLGDGLRDALDPRLRGAR
jgi:peptide/nickel transport system permease protein